MTWKALHRVIEQRGVVIETRGDADPIVTGVTHDSRQVEPGDVFVALRGQHVDGGSFARQALERGAVAIVSEAAPLESIDPSVVWTHVADARLALAVLAAELYDHPSRRMQVIGITGTNGKTTTAYLVASIFEAAGTRCGVLGTVAYRIGDDVRDATHTTPEAPDVQRLLREMVDRGCGACAMEVSSHALAQRRVDAMSFAAAVFTNLTRDHLDFHGDMESYFAAKRRLFDLLPAGAPSLINVDDPRGPVLAALVARPVTYGISRPADVTPGPQSTSLDGLSFEVRTPRGALHVRSALVGRPNVYNILAAVSVGVALGLPFDAIERGVKALTGVPGRFQVVSEAADGVTVVVDYAHTDDALKQLLETARPLTQGRLLTVFGCGGDRTHQRPRAG
jgi:UDP-N-acetylmuramoyl-L-alanyl-D-glutamate--2,6-diaminopimelate ligase